MGRYTKSTSTYLLRKRSQGVNGGAIYERNWTTLGERQRFGGGKTPIYNDGNFIFTTSYIKNPTRRTVSTSVMDTLTYEDVKDSKTTTNNVDTFPKTDKISTFAYYGSCVSLVEGAILNILATFPGCVYANGQFLMWYDEKEGRMRTFPSSGEEITINGDDDEYDEDEDEEDDEDEDEDDTTSKSVSNNFSVVLNPFNIDFFTKNPILKDSDNDLRYFSASFDKYEINGNPVKSFGYLLKLDENCSADNYWKNRIGKFYYEKGNEVYLEDEYGNIFFDGDNGEKYVKKSNGSVYRLLYQDGNLYLKYESEGKGSDVKYHYIYYKVNNEDGKTVNKRIRLQQRNIYPDSEGDIYFDGEDNATYFKDESGRVYVSTDKDISMEGNYVKWVEGAVGRITIYTENPKDVNDDIPYDIWVLWDEKGVVYITEDKEFELKPQETIIESYFDGLRGFERQLLTRDSNPMYSNTYKIPLEPSNNGYSFRYETFTWPVIKGGHYCINVGDYGYNLFVEQFLTAASAFDEFECDNLYARMTHEAIKNFDWTYTQEYNDGDEEVFIEGGERMKEILHLIGRVFDDIKINATGIKYSENITYDAFENVPEALLSDKVELKGWDAVSVIPSDVAKDEDNNGYIKLSDKFIMNNGYRWFGACSTNGFDTNTMDNNFMRRLILSSNRIFQTKGTKEAIEMVLAMFGFGCGENEDFEIIEHYYLFEAKDGDSEIDGGIKLSEYISNLVDNTASGMIADEVVSDDYINLNSVPLKYIKERVREYKKDKNTNEIKETGRWVNKHFIIPYYSQEKDYNDNFYFQSKGGWGIYEKLALQQVDYDGRPVYETDEKGEYIYQKDEEGNIIYETDEYGDYVYKTDENGDTIYEKDEDGNDKLDENGERIPVKIPLKIPVNEETFYKGYETISYLNIVSTISDLLNVPSITTNKGDIYYVVNISDFASYYDKEDIKEISHFFYLNSDFITSNYNSWVNIHNDWGDKGNDKEQYYWKKAQYLNSIVLNMLGNNPHVGYGFYDKGYSFALNLHEPFKNHVDNNDWVDEVPDINDLPVFEYEEQQGIKIDWGLNKEEIMYALVPKDDDTEEDNTIYETNDDGDEILNDIPYRVSVNSKIVTLVNKHSSKMFKKYLKETIMPYVMQVIPSTTILILKGF